VDSAAVVAALSEVMDPAELDTFSMGFSEPSFDESGAARVVAKTFGTRHHQRILAPHDLVAAAPEILGSMDLPMADPSIIPTTLLSRFAREHVKVVLGGDGGDELLMGYPTFYAEGVARWASAIPRVIRRGLIEPAAGLLPVSDRYMSLDFKLRRFLSGLGYPPHHRHLVWVGGVTPVLHGQALASRWTEEASQADLFAESDALVARIADRRPSDGPLERLAWQYFSTYLPEDVLLKVDRASMSSGLEVRAPFLDERVIRVCASLEKRLKIRGRVSKKILRDLVARAGVPADVCRRPKQGFAVPVARWLRGPLLPWVREVLDPAEVALGGLLNAQWVEKTLDEHISGRQNHAKPLWSALVLELWRRGPHGPGALGG
ncbi:MAG: asparagine synthase C-terminal domain-containing protein, partial [Myxococcota bacterium]|nr:asparagine synthase C-terminal domain-containing protein [Myxococcota bacterium]